MLWLPPEGTKHHHHHQQQQHQICCFRFCSHFIGLLICKKKKTKNKTKVLWAPPPPPPPPPPPKLQQQHQHTSQTHCVLTHNLPLLAEERVALERLVERTLGDVGEDLVLSFICGAVGDPEQRGVGTRGMRSAARRHMSATRPAYSSRKGQFKAITQA